MKIEATEYTRVSLQSVIDASKTQAERNKLGQFATPTDLALDILQYAQALLGSREVRFLDPAFGTGSFYSALLRTFSADQIASANGYEIDPSYGLETVKLWQKTSLELHVTDFTKALFPLADDKKANLLICNPPYVRHHHITKDEKTRLLSLVQQITGLRLNGLSGLYCYFLCIAHAWLADNGLAGWLIPSEFMDVKYGEIIKQYLTSQVTLLHIHRFRPEDVQFDDALTSSTVIWFIKTRPPRDHSVKFTFGGSLLHPELAASVPLKALRHEPKWSRYPLRPHQPQTSIEETTLADLFSIKRGIATGANKFFILTPEQAAKHRLPTQFLVPILPSPRYIKTTEIEADKHGNPVIDHPLFLLNCDLPEDQIEREFPSLWAYLQTGVKAGIANRYLCKHRQPWYAQEKRPPAPFLCTYMGRNNTRSIPFRFILNHSQATAPNVYLLLYPKPTINAVFNQNPELLKAVWQFLNDIPIEAMMGEGRTYGGGLHKIEPKELGNLSAESLLHLLPQTPRQLRLWI